MINSLAMPEDAERLNSYRVDKSRFGDGPWQSEPDRLQWRTKAGYPGLIVRANPELGSLCGYVGVPPGHRFHGREYDDMPTEVAVHGGLTYADRCMDDGPVCHVPEPGEPEDVWWFGFDCGHGGDLVPGLVRLRRESDYLPQIKRYEVYRDITYVRNEVESLAEQLASMATP